MVCLHPIKVPDGKGTFLDNRVPCGRCIACRVNRAEDWANRMLWESSLHHATSFITLTFDDDHLPADLSVDKRFLQLYIKRMRKYYSDRKLKYFACGEYGEQEGRPHYHLVVFGLSVADKIDLHKLWSNGFIYVTPYLKARGRYIASYLLKNVNEKIDLSGRKKPFCLMSKKMGINYLDNNINRIKNGNITVEGKIQRIPRYFIKKIKERLTYFEEQDQKLKQHDLAVDLYLKHASRVFRKEGEKDILYLDRVRESIELSRQSAEADLKFKESLKGAKNAVK